MHYLKCGNEVLYLDNAHLARCYGLGKNESGFHPTQKSIRLMQILIELTTKKDQLVLDPFAGSGSTLIAAKLLERQYLGFELDVNYVKICKDRLVPVWSY